MSVFVTNLLLLLFLVFLLVLVIMTRRLFAVVVLADRREEIQGRARFPAIEVPWRFSSFNQATIRRDGANLEATYKRAPVLVLVAKSNAWITLRLLADMAVNLEAKRKSTALLLSQRCLQFVDYMLNKDMQKT